MGLLEKLDNRNSNWAARKIASEKKRRPDTSYPVVSTAHGLFSVTVVDLESERLRFRYAVAPEPVLLFLAAVVLLIRYFTKTRKPKKRRYEARVTSLAFPERRVADTAFSTRAEAQAMQRQYEQRLRSGWNPTEEGSHRQNGHVPG